MAIEIAPGIIQFQAIRGANSYACIKDGGISIIDTGLPGNGERIVAQIRDWGMTRGNVRYIVLTHSDIDHCGSADELRRLTNAPIAIHAADAGGLTDRDLQKKTNGLVGLGLSLVKRLLPFRPAVPNVTLQDGDKIGGLTVIHTSGHTTGSICLFDPGLALFAGDAVRANGKGAVMGPSRMLSADIDKAWESVRVIADLRYNLLLPGHGKPIVNNAGAAVKELLANGGRKK